MKTMYRVGHGYDAHRFSQGRKLILGGVSVDYEYGLAGHSDADVLIHAVMDALLGAAALGDIGVHFPPTDSKYKDISSMILLSEVRKLIAQKGYRVVNVDATVVAQKPKLAAYLEDMKNNIAEVLDIHSDSVNVKATTEENMGFTGRLEGVSAHSVCILIKE
jgi:2-C-methyl-D-erythritol 2,4-cyclodiphosphate synthase